MPFISRAEVRYLTFDIFGSEVIHAVFTRRGGVSPKPWASLNLGGTVGDDPARVAENRRRAFAALGRDPASLYDVWQVHGTHVAVAEAPRLPAAPYLQADAIATDRPHLTLVMRFADCAPLLFYDPEHRVIALAHAGWMGTINDVTGATVAALRARFGTQPASLLAAIGPSIGPDHYEVGPDVVLQARQRFGSESSAVLLARNGRIYFDLWAANRLLLERAGVRQIEVAGLCTACHVDDWYSHRFEQGRTGRFGVLMALRERG